MVQLGTALLLKHTPADLEKNQLSDPYFEMVVKLTVLNNTDGVWQRNDRENYKDISIFCHIYNLGANECCLHECGG